MPSEWFPFVFAALVFWAGALAYHEVRSKNRTLRSELESAIKPPAFQWSGSVKKGGDYYYGHAVVTNKGGSRAIRCRVQLEALRRTDNYALVDGFSPFILKWDGHKGSEREVGIDLDARQSTPLSVCASPLKNSPQWLPDISQTETLENPVPGVRFIPATDAPSVANISFAPGIYMATLRILGANINGSEAGVTEDFLVRVGDVPESLEFCLDPMKHVI